MKIVGSILLIFLLPTCLLSATQNKTIKHPNYYLIDSIDFSSIGLIDSLLIDSIIRLYHETSSDTTRLRLLDNLIDECVGDHIWGDYNDLMMKSAKDLLKLKGQSKKTKIFCEQIISEGLNNQGYLAEKKGNRKKAISLYTKSIEQAKKSKNLEGLARTYNNLGLVYKKQGNISKAMELYHQSLKIRESLVNKKGIAYCLHNIGSLFIAMGDYKNALNYLNRSLKIKNNIKDDWGATFTLSKIAQIYEIEKNYNDALKNLFKILTIREELDDQIGIGDVKGIIGKVYRKLKNTEKSLQYLNEAIAIYKVMGEGNSAITTYQNLGEIFFEDQQFELAKIYTQKSLELSEKMASPYGIEEASLLMSKILRIENRLPEAIKMMDLHITMKNKTVNEENRKNTARQQIKYEFEKNQTLRELEHQNQLSTIAYSVIGVLATILTFTLILLKRLKITRKQKRIIELQKEVTEDKRQQVEKAHQIMASKNKEIIDSINYAKRIQKALLQSEEHVSKHLPPHFILFLPKDIVSGDFYWTLEKHGYFYVAVADCTGHGVPGAFMSMLGIAFLNEINAHEKNLLPSEILNQLRYRIIKELNQTGEIGQNREGMDISLARLNLSTNELVWAGSNNPIWIIRSDTTPKTGATLDHLEEIKGDKQPIAFFRDMKPFTDHHLTVKTNDKIYLFTDGYQDQFGGPKGKKLKSRVFKELILKHHAKTMDAQKEILYQAFENWKGDHEQLDDICVLSVRID